MINKTLSDKLASVTKNLAEGNYEFQINEVSKSISRNIKTINVLKSISDGVKSLVVKADANTPCIPLPVIENERL